MSILSRSFVIRSLSMVVTCGLIPSTWASAVKSAAPAIAVSRSAITHSERETKVQEVSPVNSSGRIRSGFKITLQLNGRCVAGSNVVSAPTYRCFAESSMYDPCWRVNPSSSIKAVVCLPIPWSRKVIKVNIGSALPETYGSKIPNLELPWGIVLTSGVRCLAINGATGNFDGMGVHYACRGRGGLYLLDYPHREQSVWSIRSAIYHEKGYFTAGPTMYLREAYFAT